MADDVRTTNDRVVVTGGAAGRGTTFLAWLAVLLAALALTLAWTAYNRTGQDLEDKIRQEIREELTVPNENTEANNTQNDVQNNGTTEDTNTDGNLETEAQLQP